MLLQSLSLIGNNFAIFSGFAILFVALLLFQDFSGTEFTHAITIGWAALSFLAMKAMIRDDGKILGATKSTVGLWSFFWKIFLLTFLPTLPIGLVGGGVMSRFGSSTGYMYLAAILAFVFVEAVVLALFGTWPISKAAGGPTTFQAAYRRGKRGFLIRVGRIGSALVFPSVVSFAFLLVGVNMAEGLTFSASPAVAVVAVFYLIAIAFQTVGMAYLSVIIANCYMEGDQTDLVPASAPSM